MWTYLLGPVLSLLPSRWRTRLPFAESINWQHAAFISGFFQIWFSIYLLVAWYSYSVTHHTRRDVFLVLRELHAHVGDPAKIGLIALIFVALNPVTWVIGAWGIEGGIRVLGAAITGDIIGTYPLWAIDRFYCAVERWTYNWRVPVVADKVTSERHGDVEILCIKSCRPKPNWQNHPTIRYHDEFFQVSNVIAAADTQKYIYHLRRLQPGEMFRGLEDYDPRDVLRRTRKDGFLVSYYRALRK